MIPASYYLYLSAILFVLGIIGVFARRNLILILISIELMLNAVNLAFVTFSNQLGKGDGEVFVIFIMIVASVQVGVGLALLTVIFRKKSTIDVDEFNLLG